MATRWYKTDRPHCEVTVVSVVVVAVVLVVVVGVVAVVVECYCFLILFLEGLMGGCLQTHHVFILFHVSSQGS